METFTELFGSLPLFVCHFCSRVVVRGSPSQELLLRVQVKTDSPRNWPAVTKAESKCFHRRGVGAA